MTLHALPGMGANTRMYPTPWETLPGIRLHDWPKYQGETSLPAVAARVCEVCGIEDGDSIVGSSLGGMVACEIAKLRRLERLFLIGSAVSPAEISELLRFLRPLSAVVPIDTLRRTVSSVPLELAQMFQQADAAFIRAMCKAVFAWEGLGRQPVRVFRLHGSSDLIIPPPHQADLLLSGGHLISMTHAVECVAFVRERCGGRPSAVP